MSLVARWQQAGGATVFSSYLNYPGSQYERLIRWSRLKDSPETDIIEDLLPYVAHARAIIDKTIYTVFTEQGRAIVRDGAWTDLVFCGIATESCVLKSAVDAFELGYTPWIVTDATASDGGDVPHEAGLLVAGRFIGGGQLINGRTLASKLLPVSA